MSYGWWYLTITRYSGSGPQFEPRSQHLRTDQTVTPALRSLRRRSLTSAMLSRPSASRLIGLLSG
jgi:hypothetical protein